MKTRRRLIGERTVAWRGGVGSLIGALMTAACGSGCVPIAAAWANITGGEWIDAQFTLTKEPLLILIDDRNSQVTEPRAIRELHKTISANFLEFRVNQMVIPFEEAQRLAQTDPQYSRYSIRQIGEKLGAEQVLYLRVDRFTVSAEPGAPIYKGEFTVRVKVLATDRKQDIRLWPSEESGKRVSATTPPVPADSEKTAGDIATELGIKLGKEVAMLFYGHREMQK
jgi:hypothetical protein